jgi:glucose-1-phosphate thymidylyltransferase
VKGIVLAGGAGTRLHPITRAVSKQLLPVYDKPMIYYPLSILMLAGIRDILLITAPHDQDQFVRLLGDGSQCGVSLSYAVQPSPDGLAQAFIIGADHVGKDDVALVLGGQHHLRPRRQRAVARGHDAGGHAAWLHLVRLPGQRSRAVRGGRPRPRRRVGGHEEKPRLPRSNLAVTGLYFYDADGVEIAAGLRPSARGELEITDLNRVYIQRGDARLVDLGRGTAWLDTGTQDSLMEAGQFAQVFQRRQGLTIACLEEIAMRQHFITAEQALEHADEMGKSSYGEYLRRAAAEFVIERASA